MHGAPHRPVQRARPEDCREEAERPCRTRPETKQPRARRLGHQRPHDVQVFLLSFHVVLAEGHHPLRGSAREAQARAEARAPQCAAVYFHSSKLACMVRLELRPQPLREAGMLLPCQRRELLDLGAAAAERPELEPPDAIARARRGHTLKETMVAAQRNLQESAPHSARHCPLCSPCGRPKAHNVMGSPKAHRTSLGVHVAHKIFVTSLIFFSTLYQPPAGTAEWLCQVRRWPLCSCSMRRCCPWPAGRQPVLRMVGDSPRPCSWQVRGSALVLPEEEVAMFALALGSGVPGRVDGCLCVHICVHGCICVRVAVSSRARVCARARTSLACARAACFQSDGTCKPQVAENHARSVDADCL